MFAIYKITNLIDGKVYIGATTYSDPYQRWKKHLTIAKYPETHKRSYSYLHKAIHKYGAQNFKFEVVCELPSRIDMFNKECELIKNYNSAYYEYGYNLSLGGEGNPGCIHTEEGKKIIGEACRKRSLGNKYFEGQTHTEEYKEYMSKLITDMCKNGIIKRKSGIQLSEIIQEQIVNDYNSGFVFKELQKKYNVGKSLLGRIMKKFGIKTDKTRKTKEGKQNIKDGSLKINDELAAEIHNMYMTGNYTQIQLTKIYNVSKGSIHRIIAKFRAKT